MSGTMTAVRFSITLLSPNDTLPFSLLFFFASAGLVPAIHGPAEQVRE
jgi:hypothetical protein